MKKLHLCFKIVEVDGDNYKTLFHGVNGSRTLPCCKWIKAAKKEVTDGDARTAKRYTSGFHVLKTKVDTTRYLKKFKRTDNKIVIRVIARGLRPKEHSKMSVFLADEIYLAEET